MGENQTHLLRCVRPISRPKHFHDDEYIVTQILHLWPPFRIENIFHDQWVNLKTFADSFYYFHVMEPDYVDPGYRLGI